jgi:hypothetical protein
MSQFPPGHYYDSASGELVRYYQQPWRDYADVQGVPGRSGRTAPGLRARGATPADDRRAVRRAAVRRPGFVAGGGGGALCTSPHRGWGQTEAWWPRLHSPIGGLARPGRGCDRRRSAGHRASRLRVHLRGRPGCVAGSDPPHRDLRRHHHPRIDADVPAGAADQGDGREDGAFRRGQRRSSAATCTSTRRRMRANSTRSWCASSMRCTTTTACAPTSR